MDAATARVLSDPPINFLCIAKRHDAWDALGRQILLSAIDLAVEAPVGIAIALNMPKRAF